VAGCNNLFFNLHLFRNLIQVRHIPDACHNITTSSDSTGFIGSDFLFRPCKHFSAE
jgi:hypothetical protein